MDIHDGARALHVTIDGDDSHPPVLLLHGITATGRTWDWLVPHLVARYRVIRLDFRGHGGSARTPGEYQPAGYVADAVAACRQVAGAPCVVIGHSLGGVTAAALAQQHPELVRALVLEDPPLGIGRSPEGGSLMNGFRLMRESVPGLQQSGITADVLAGILAAAPSPSGPTFAELLHPDAMAAMASGMLQLDASVLDRVLDGSIEPVYDPALPIVAPTLLLTADPSSPDAVARPADVELLLASSPQVQVKVMIGSGHLIHDELAQRSTFLDEVLRFLAQLG